MDYLAPEPKITHIYRGLRPNSLIVVWAWLINLPSYLNETIQIMVQNRTENAWRSAEARVPGLWCGEGDCAFFVE